jgi:hypothetical protein
VTQTGPSERPLLLDASFLLAYERDRYRRAMALVVEMITDGRILVASAISLTIVAAELAGRHPDLSWLVEDTASPLQVLSLSGTNAFGVGARAAQTAGPDAAALELAHIVHEASAIRAVVLTYEPKLYYGHPIHIFDMTEMRLQ